MLTIVQSDDFKTEIQTPFCKTKSSIQLKGFPTFYEDGEYVMPINLWMNHLINVKRAKNINSNVRAISRYWRFLKSHELSWKDFPTIKSNKPTYIFRNQDLLASVKAGELNSSTAAVYMNHIIKFYEWAYYERLINFSKENKPFEVEFVSIKTTGMLAHINRNYVVRSSDLRIRVPRRTPEQSLNPLTEDEVKLYSRALKEQSIEFQIHQLLQLMCGLRIEEACTFPANLVNRCDPNKYHIQVSIGPHNGVLTKFGSVRTIEIPTLLMNKMHRYLISERRQKRESKTDKPITELLITNRGKPYTTNAIQRHFSLTRNYIRNELNTHFQLRTHDLRATYGTFRLASLLDEKVGLSPFDAMSLIMGWMGHKDEKTTWRYLNFINRSKASIRAVCFLDQVMESVINEHEDLS